MNTTDLQAALIPILESLADARDEIEGDNDDITLADIARDLVDDVEGMSSAVSFADAALLTRSAGVVIRTQDGAEFQVSIVQSRRGCGE
ncbi:MAG: hypothetical protein WAZ94_08435 [Phycisphaerales bacterium]